MNLSKYLGMRVGTGIVTGARWVTGTVAEFDVLDDGVRTAHRIDTARIATATVVTA